MRAAIRLMQTAGVDAAIIGDVLEAVSGRSVFWLWRQVSAIVILSLLHRAAIQPLALVVWTASVFVAAAGRLTWDTLSPPADYVFRSLVTTWLAVGTCLGAGFWGAFTARMRSGVSVAIAAHVLGQLLTIAFTGALYVTVIRPDLSKLDEFQSAGGWEEVLFLPVMLLPVVTALAAIGAGAGHVARRFLRPF